MGRRGFAPEPTALKKIKGNPGRRPLNEEEPEPTPERLGCPEELNGEAAVEWHRMVDELYACGLLTKVDRAALMAYCMAYARWIVAEKNLRRTGTLVKRKDGAPMLSPYLAVVNDALKHMLAFMREFGLTPSSRSRLKAAKPEDMEDPGERFFLN